MTEASESTPTRTRADLNPPTPPALSASLVLWGMLWSIVATVLVVIGANMNGATDMWGNRSTDGNAIIAVGGALGLLALILFVRGVFNALRALDSLAVDAYERRLRKG